MRDVSVIHAQKADRKGNVLLWGILGVQKEAALAAKRCIVTVEEIVDELDAPMNACVLPELGAQRRVPGARRRASVLCPPTSATTASTRNGTRSPATAKSFTAWIDEYIRGDWISAPSRPSFAEGKR